MLTPLQTASEIRRLEALIHDRIGQQVADLEIDIDETGVYLAGRAPSYYVKQLAQQVIGESCGLPLAANRIIVKRT